MSSPLPLQRLTSLFLAFAFAVIGGSVGLNALIKSNQEKSYLSKYTPEGTTVYFDTSNVYDTGIVITTVCALLALLTLIYLIVASLSSCSFQLRGISQLSGTSPAALSLQGATMLFCAVWLFATLIPFDVFFASDSAQVTAYVGGVEVSPTIIQDIEAELGLTPVYRHIYYLKLVAILPWLTFLFAVISSGIHFAAAKSAASRLNTSMSSGREKTVV